MVELPPEIADLEDLGPLGEGGMGVVRRVYDPVLRRELALKVLRPELQGEPTARARFLREARLMARLQHPGVVPVTALGRLPDGRLGLVMQEVRGRTLTACIAEVHARRSGLRRLVELIGRVAGTVAYAHSQGVLHRDLKPDNVMVGDFGEVYVLDWGLARAPGDPEAEPITAVLPESATRSGEVLGTPMYMAPEQALGEPVGPAADVYALGAMLHQALSGQPPLPPGDLWDLIGAATRGERRPLQGALPVPEALARLVDQAMDLDPARRPADAGAMARALEAWLDDSRRREQALATVAEADALLPQIEALRAESAEKAAEAGRLLDALPIAALADQKAPAWALDDEARALSERAVGLEGRRVQLLHAALHGDPDNPEAAARLADHYQARHAAAEAAGDPSAPSWEALLRATDRGRHAGWLRGEGELALATEPPGALARLWRPVSRGRRLEPVLEADLGPTPLLRALPRGPWLLTLELPGYEPLRLGLRLERGARWDGGPRGEDPWVWRMIPLGRLDPGEALIPAGPFLAGGDPGAADGLPARTVWLDSYVLRRDPVTIGEYTAFLADVRDPALLPRPLPSDQPDQVRWEPEGPGWVARCAVVPAEALLRWPVTRVSWRAATAFAAWAAARGGLPWRLPHEFEREKAGRGGDGRPLPWGEHYEPGWSAAQAGMAGRPAPRPVDATPGDVSLYGVRGLAGNVSDWCANPWRRDGPPLVGDRLLPDAAEAEFMSVRGGNYTSSARLCRLASRLAGRPDEVFSTVGFRLARSL